MKLRHKIASALGIYHCVPKDDYLTSDVIVIRTILEDAINSMPNRVGNCVPKVFGSQNHKYTVELNKPAFRVTIGHKEVCLEYTYNPNPNPNPKPKIPPPLYTHSKDYIMHPAACWYLKSYITTLHNLVLRKNSEETDRQLAELLQAAIKKL